MQQTITSVQSSVDKNLFLKSQDVGEHLKSPENIEEVLLMQSLGFTDVLKSPLHEVRDYIGQFIKDTNPS